MRDYSIASVVIGDPFRLELSPPAAIILGGDALLSKGPLYGPGIHVAKIKEYDKSSLDGLIGARLLSTVGFKEGWLRIGFTGWEINVPDDGDFIYSAIESDGSKLWCRPDANSAINTADVIIYPTSGNSAH
jgi:hypothetical protein